MFAIFPVNFQIVTILSHNRKGIIITHVYNNTAKSLPLCRTLRSHRQQPIRLHRPWDSPGKNTGVGCYFLLQCMKVNEVTQSCLTLSDPMDCSRPGSSIHGIFQARVLEWVAIAFSVTITRNRYYFSEIHPYITFLGYLCRI